MKELIKIESKMIGAETVNSVNARELHKTLEIKKQFTTWITHQIKSLGLEENIDYIIFSEKITAGRGTTIRKEYIITTDTAKHISMASRTAKGKEIRNYFIDIEKQVFLDGDLSKLNGRIGGLSSSNNKLKSKVKKLSSEVEDMKSQNYTKLLDSGITDKTYSLIQKGLKYEQMEITHHLFKVHSTMVLDNIKDMEKNMQRIMKQIPNLENLIDNGAIRDDKLGWKAP